MNSPSAAALLAHPQKLSRSPCSRALQQIRSVRPIAFRASIGSIDNGHDSTSPRSSRTAASHSPAGGCTSSSNTENCPTMYCWVTETSKNALPCQRTAQRPLRQQARSTSAVSPRFTPAASRRGAVSAPSTRLPLLVPSSSQLDTAASDSEQDQRLSTRLAALLLAGCCGAVVITDAGRSHSARPTAKRPVSVPLLPMAPRDLGCGLARSAAHPPM